jgi:hypothetical protein
MGASPPALVADLVERFERDRKVFLSPDYKEEQLRFESGRRPVIRHSELGLRTFLGVPVIHEESIKVAGATKAPDYTFRIGGRRVFVEVTTPLGCEEQRRDASDTSDLSFQSLLSLLSLPSLLRSASRA